MGLLLPTMLCILLVSSARPACAHASPRSTPGRFPLAFHTTPTPPSGLSGTGSRRSCLSSGLRGAQRVANLRREHQGRTTLRMLLPIMMDSPRRAGKLSVAAAADGAAAAAGGGSPAVKTTRLQAFESTVQKWCDRATSLFPAWVLGAAAVGMLRPAALSWFNSGLITAALATTMVSLT
ncbi:unnamed protein product [Ectocarpus fasciculatus]